LKYFCHKKKNALHYQVKEHFSYSLIKGIRYPIEVANTLPDSVIFNFNPSLREEFPQPTEAFLFSHFENHLSRGLKNI